MLRFKILLGLLTLLSSMAISQIDLSIGEWQNHLPLRDGLWVSQSPKNVIYSTGRALVFIDKEELSTRVISKIDGLSETYIKRVEFDPFNNQVFVIYNSSNIDIIREEGILNLPEIRENSNIIGSREIQDIHFVSESSCFMATAFGIIELNPQRLEFRTTTFTNQSINTVSSDNDFIYAATAGRIFRVAKSVTNKADFLNWQAIGSEVGLPVNYFTEQLINSGGNLYALIDGEIWLKKENSEIFEIIEGLDIPGFNIFNIDPSRDKGLIVSLRNNQFNSLIIKINGQGAKQVSTSNCNNRIINAIEDETGRFWTSDLWGRFRFQSGINGICESLDIPGIYAYESRRIISHKGEVFIASGGISDNFSYTFSRSGFYIFNQRLWQNINESVYSVLNQREFINMSCIVPHPRENKVYVGSYYSGILEYDRTTNEFKFWDKDNSAMQGRTGDNLRTTVTDMQFDRDGNLWIANFESARPITVLTKEGIWHSFNIPGSTSLSSMSIDQNGNLWFTVSGTSASVVVYDPGRNIADPSDDRVRVINRSNSLITGNFVHSVATDLNGAVWVGTSEGPIIFDCNPFDNNCRGTKRIVLQDDIPGFLLETEEILCIAVDGANNKWFGTRNGIFVQSPDGRDQILRFTAENSALLDNNITALGFEPTLGEMFIGSNGGIQSYRTNTTGATSRHSNEVYAYPNPVRPDYEGPIAIKGLARDAIVKITDMNGKLIFETQALGGQAVWNGRDYTGRRAATGVYLVFSTGEVSFGIPDSFVTKILIVN